MDIDRAFEVSHGLKINDGIGIASGDAVPIGMSAPTGTKYLQTVGLVWLKFGPDDDDWRIFPRALDVPFADPDAILVSENVNDAIIEAYIKAKGIKTFPYELHYGNGANLNVTMSNGSFFRVRPGVFSSGSYSGYPSAFPLQLPFRSRLKNIILTFRVAAFDWNATAGHIQWDLEVRGHTYNGSSVSALLNVKFGNFSGSSTGHSFHRFEIDDFTVLSGANDFDYGEMIGCRFVKSASGNRRINSFTDIVMKLNFEELVI